MKKSMLNVITLALVFINLVLTVILTFSLVSTNNKTNGLITKVAEIIDLDVGGGASGNNSSSTTASIDNIEYIDVTSDDGNKITIPYTENGKTHYAVLTVSIGVNKKSKDYKSKKTSLTNGMKLISNQVYNEALKYSYSTITSNKTTMEANLLKELQDLFQTDMITSILVNIVVQ